MKLLVEIPDDGDWVVQTAGERHQFAGELVLSYVPYSAPPDIKVLRRVDENDEAGRP